MFYANIIFFSTVLFIFLVIIFYMAIAWFSFAPWVPARSRDLQRIFKLANLKPGEIFYDLGCGDGKLVFYAAKYFKAKAIGVEIAFPLFCLCLIKKFFLRQPDVIFKLKNLFHEDLSKAEVIYFFGLPESINNKLKDKLEREIKPGTRIISYAFQIKDWLPQTVNKEQNNDLPIYLYIKQ